MASSPGRAVRGDAPVPADAVYGGRVGATAEATPVLETDVVRLSPYMRRHVTIHRHHSFQLPETAGSRRELRDPDTSDDNDAM